MAAPVSTSKICLVCRKDLAGIKRVKDPSGNYYCEPCYAAAIKKGKRGGEAERMERVERGALEAAPMALAPTDVIPLDAIPLDAIPLADEEVRREVSGKVSKASVPPAVVVKAETMPCPSCGAAVGVGSVLCVSCGFNLKSGTKVATTTLKKSVDWLGYLGVVPLEVYLAVGGMVVFFVFCVVTHFVAEKPTHINSIGFAIVIAIILTAGSRKCRRVLVDEYGWSPTLFRIPIVRNFVFLGGLVQAPKLWLITLRYWAAAFVFGVAGFVMLIGFAVPEVLSHAKGRPAVVSHAADFAAPQFVATEEGLEKAEMTCAGPDGTERQLWVYRASGKVVEHSMPCVFIAPGGIRAIYGASLNEDAADECVTYAKAGFVVVAYSVDGKYEQAEGAAAGPSISAIKAFKAADGGIKNAQRAIGYALDQLPEVDPHRLYAEGGYLSGSLALDVAASDARIAAVEVTFPIGDFDAVEGSDGAMAQLQFSIPDIHDFVTQHSPVKHVKEMRCPIFVFEPGLDFMKVKPLTDAYVNALKDAGADVKCVVGSSDIETLKKQTELPGITWLKSISAEAAASQGGKGV